jgi:hypothetical protein
MIRTIFAVNDCAKIACMVKRTSGTTGEEHGWLLIQPAVLPQWSSGFSRSALQAQEW